MVFNCRSLFNEAAYLAALRRLRSPFAIRDADSKQSKTKIYEKSHLLLRILAVIGRFGPHLTVVMIFVTQRNFSNGPGISDRLLGFYPRGGSLLTGTEVTEGGGGVAVPKHNTVTIRMFLRFPFCVLLILMANATRQCPQTTTFECLALTSLSP